MDSLPAATSTDKIRYIVLLFLSYPLAFILRRIFHYKYTSSTVRHVYCVLLGILFCWICFEWQTLYLVTFVSLGYLFLVMVPPRNLHIYSMIYAMLGLSAGHIYRMVTDYGGYKLDFTGPMMLIVQRISYVAFAYHDGLSNNELNEDQETQKIKELPTLLEYFSYNFCFLTVLAGPTTSFKDYNDFITGRNMFSSNQNIVTEPDPFIPMLKKLTLSVMFLLLLVFNSDRLSRNLILDSSLSYPRWYMNVVIFCFIGRCMYNFSHLIVESICNAGGLGFNGYDDMGNEKWDLVRGIDVYKLEFPTNARDVILAWNICTVIWIRRVIYERVPWNPVLVVHVISAIWHGFYPGYYLTFIYVGIGTLAGRKWRRFFWHRFQKPPIAKMLYDAFTTTVMCICRDFAQICFSLLLWSDVFTIMKYYYFSPIICVIIVIVTLPNRKMNKST